MKLTKLNEMQMPTWRWLHMNATDVDVDASIDVPYKQGPDITGAENIDIQHMVSNEIPGDLPQDMKRMLDFVSEKHNYALTLTIPDNVQLKEPIMLDFLLEEQSPALLDHLTVLAGQNAKADIIVRYRSSGGTHFHCGFTSLHVEAGADIRLIKAQTLGREDTHIDMTAVAVEQSGNANVILCELGGGQAVGGCNVALRGAESRACLDGLYLGSDSRRQDFNYRMEMAAPKSQGEIFVKGALAGKAKKVLKSTLDFLSGAAGSVGRERETVLALSDKALNLSIPLLLCGEENVEGEHATNTGKPDPSKLFYLMSRGFSELEAKRLLVEASFAPTLNKIPVEALRADLLARMREVMQHAS